ncbi:DUF3800 domain-containing protein [Actinomyces slackii]|uniref:Protein of uncharacterized function (DUF3800) n=1 Tax=Actinomyces slackii TaxID=52774 RepID=A0A448KDI6_9ACTO|nr:DUF3800 domain-containing protein [Actinomyces slackii]VEG74989.1 Protein of uncharacterised function (DUF3800) [Actinomyces slackii]
MSSQEWVAYLDESQQRSHYFVGAALAPEDVWQEIASRLAALRSSIASTYGIPADIEFHGNPLMNGKDGWEPLRGRHREVANTYLRALTTLDGLESPHLLFYGVDVQRLNARYKYPMSPHEVCMDHLLERIDDFARSQGLGQVMVVADQSSQEKQLQDRFARNQRLGTVGYRRSRLEQIKALEFRSSADTDGLQIVDLALYLRQRAFHVPQEKHPQGPSKPGKTPGKDQSANEALGSMATMKTATPEGWLC